MNNMSRYNPRTMRNNEMDCETFLARLNSLGKGDFKLRSSGHYFPEEFEIERLDSPGGNEKRAEIRLTLGGKYLVDHVEALLSGMEPYLHNKQSPHVYSFRNVLETQKPKDSAVA